MLQKFHEIVWGPGTLLLFLSVGVLFSIRIRLFQIFGFARWWRTTAGSILKENRAGEKGTISSFQSACTALAATIGTGNITGVATALLAGGPGAVFWMWISAFLGMATAYAETELGIHYRRRNSNGDWLSGPMLYLERGLHSRKAGILYAVFCLAASFGMGSMVQANAISETLEFSFSFPPIWVGTAMAIMAALILAGGARRIAGAAEKMVPLSAGIYIAASLFLIFCFRRNLPTAFGLIFKDAFSLRSAAGGVAGYGISSCMRYGIARGVFSNEAGLGSLAVLNGGVDDNMPGVQGQWAIFEVFVDTIVCCTMTALVILCVVGGDPRTVTDNGAALTGACFAKGLGILGGHLVSICIVMFAFATIIAWYYMGKQSVTYLGEALGCDLEFFYLAIYLIAVFIGSLGPMEQVWTVSDLFNGLMAVPNLIALVLLARQVEQPER